MRYWISRLYKISGEVNLVPFSAPATSKEELQKALKFVREEEESLSVWVEEETDNKHTLVYYEVFVNSLGLRDPQVIFNTLELES